jgi:hypothetical protein
MATKETHVAGIVHSFVAKAGAVLGAWLQILWERLSLVRRSLARRRNAAISRHGDVHGRGINPLLQSGRAGIWSRDALAAEIEATRWPNRSAVLWPALSVGGAG